MTVEPSVVETREEHARDTDYAQSRLVEKVEQIAWENQVMSRTVETRWVCGRHSCLIDDGMRN